MPQPSPNNQPLRIIGQLFIILAFATIAGLVFVFFAGEMLSSSPPNDRPSTSSANARELEVISSRINRSTDRVFYVEGEVRNVSDVELGGIMAIVSVFDKSGTLVTTSESRIAFNPLEKGARSTFKVPFVDAQAVESYKVEFKDGSGRRLSLKNGN